MEKLRWGLIGAGDIVEKRVAPALMSLANCELVGVARNRAELAESFADEFGIKKSYGDWRETLEDDEIDAVYIATPVFLHAEQTIAAAQAGKHVLCEKPMAINASECTAMIDACTANDVKLGVAYYRRFYPVLERVRQAIASGEIGKPVFVQINSFEYVDLAPNDARGWFLEKEKSGGGPMMDFGCHRIEVLTDLFGKITRSESMLANIHFKREVEDTAAVLFQFEKGTCASVVVTHAAIEPQDTLDIFGTKGSIRIPVLNKGEIEIKTAEGTRNESYPPDANFHLPLISDFIEAVLTGREPRVGGECGKMIAVIEDEIYKSN